MVLSRDKQSFIQAIRIDSNGFGIEFRDGADNSHFRSEREDISQKEVIDIFVQYYEGKRDLASALQWNPLFFASRGAKQQPKRGSLATFKNAVLSFIVAAVTFGFSQIEYRQTDDLEKNLGEATGKVLSAKLHSGIKSSSGSPSYSIILSYTANEKVLVVEHVIGWEVHAGDTVPVVYDKRDPGGVRFVRSRDQIWRAYYFYLVISVITGLLSVPLFVLAWRGRASTWGGEKNRTK